jgi:rod shape-determining protein MreD
MSSRIYLIFPLMLILLLLQVTAAPYFELYGIAPQLLFVITIAWTLYFGVQQGLIWAFAGGMLLDLFSAGPMGASALALMAAVGVVAFIQRLLPQNRILIPLALGAVASLVYWLVYISLLRILVPFMLTSLDYLSASGAASGTQGRSLINAIAGEYGFGGSVGAMVLASTIIHSLIILPLYWALSTIDRLVRPRSIEI